MADQALLSFLSGTPFFGGLDPVALEAVASMMVPHDLAANTDVFHEGDQGSSLFVVRSGTLSVWHQGPPGESLVKLTKLGPGDFFGEMTLVEMQPRSASVTAETDTSLLELRKGDLYKLYKTDVKSYVLVLQNMNRELCRRLRKANQRLVEWASHAHDLAPQVQLK